MPVGRERVRARLHPDRPRPQSRQARRDDAPGQGGVRLVGRPRPDHRVDGLVGARPVVRRHLDGRAVQAGTAVPGALAARVAADEDGEPRRGERLGRGRREPARHAPDHLEGQVQPWREAGQPGARRHHHVPRHHITTGQPHDGPVRVGHDLVDALPRDQAGPSGTRRPDRRDHRPLRPDDAGVLLVEADRAVVDAVLREALPHLEGGEDLVLQAVRGRGRDRAAHHRRPRRPEHEATGPLDQLLPGHALQLVPEPPGLKGQRDVGGALGVGGADDPRLPVAGATVVAGRELLDADDPSATPGEPPERVAPHRAQADDHHVGVGLWSWDAHPVGLPPAARRPPGDLTAQITSTLLPSPSAPCTAGTSKEGRSAGTAAGGKMSPRRSDTDPDNLLRVLRTSPVFSGGEPATLVSLVREAAPMPYPAGAFLFRQGEPAAHVFVLTKGEVAVVSPARGGAEQVHGILGRGDLLGELALLAHGRRTAGARATSATVAWAIGRDAFWAFLDATPSASSALLRQVAERLAAREALIDDLLSLDVKGRLANALLRLTDRELAGMVGASRENVSRALATFRKRGLVAYDATAIRVLDPAALRRLT